MGLRPAERYPELFSAAIQNLPVGGVAGPLRSAAGFHILKLALLQRFGADQRIVRGAVPSAKGARPCSNCRSSRPLTRPARALPRDPAALMSRTVRTVLFAPEDLALVKGDPEQRRRVSMTSLSHANPAGPQCVPTTTGSCGSATPAATAFQRSVPGVRVGGPSGRGSGYDAQAEPEAALGTPSTCGTTSWPRRRRCCCTPAAAAGDRRSRSGVRHGHDSASDARAVYRSSLGEAEAAALAAGEVPEPVLREAMLRRLTEVRSQGRGARSRAGGNLHRDDAWFSLVRRDAQRALCPAHGESWSFALGLRLAVPVAAP